MKHVRFSALGAVFLGLLLAASGCSKKKEEPKEPAKVSANSEKKAKAPKRAPKKPQVDEELVKLSKVVKTEEDFEQAAEKEILPENLEGQVDKLEQELAPAQ
jgi:hypothetical protein